MLSITKTNKWSHSIRTTVVWDKETKVLVASRLIKSTILTITTQEPKSMDEFATRFNNVVELSNVDFELLSDIKDYEVLID